MCLLVPYGNADTLNYLNTFADDIGTLRCAGGKSLRQIVGEEIRDDIYSYLLGLRCDTRDCERAGVGGVSVVPFAVLMRVKEGCESYAKAMLSEWGAGKDPDHELNSGYYSGRYSDIASYLDKYDKLGEASDC